MKKLVILGLFVAAVMMANTASALCSVTVTVYDSLGAGCDDEYWTDCLRILIKCNYPNSPADTLYNNGDTWTWTDDPPTWCIPNNGVEIYAICEICGPMRVTTRATIDEETITDCDDEGKTIPVSLCILPDAIPCL